MMKRLLLILLVTALTLSFGCTKSSPEITADITPQPAPSQIIADITTQEASALIEENPDLIIIDVRTRAEFDSGHIENAINIDRNFETFRDELDNLDKDKTYLVYCAMGVRSANARDIMKELGFMEAYNMLDGINQWKADGLPITQ